MNPNIWKPVKITSWLPFVGGWHCSFHLRLLSASGATQALSLPPCPSKPSSAAACEVFVSSSMSSISLTTSNAGITTNSIKPEEKVIQMSTDLSKISKSLSKMNTIVARLWISEEKRHSIDWTPGAELQTKQYLRLTIFWQVDNLFYFQFLRWKMKYIAITDHNRFFKKERFQSNGKKAMPLRIHLVLFQFTYVEKEKACP